MSTKSSWADKLRYNKQVRWVSVHLPVKWKWLLDFLYPDDAEVTFKNKLPWCERINMLAVNPNAANRDDVAKLASELGDTYRLLERYEQWEADLILDLADRILGSMSDKNYRSMMRLQEKRNAVLKNFR